MKIYSALKTFHTVLFFIFFIPGLLPGMAFANADEDREDWFDAVHNEEIDKLQIMLQNGMDIDTKNHKGNTALKLAAKNNYVKLAMFLIDHKADVNTSSNKYSTPLQAAARRGYIDMVRLLLKHGADVNVQDKKGRTALMKATKHGHSEIASLLLTEGANNRVVSKNFVTPLIAAARGSDLATLQTLLGKGADPWHEDVRGLNVLQQDGTTSAMRDIIMGTMNATSIVFHFPVSVTDNKSFVKAAMTAMNGRGWMPEQVSEAELNGLLHKGERIFKVHLQRIGDNLVIEYLPGYGSNKRHYLEFIKEDMLKALGLISAD